jgi:hypothetical protein
MFCALGAVALAGAVGMLVFIREYPDHGLKGHSSMSFFINARCNTLLLLELFGEIATIAES